jgi:hypothetical protein
VTFTAQFGTDLSMLGNIALGYQLVTVTSVGDSSVGWTVTLSETLLGRTTLTDTSRGGTALTDAAQGNVTTTNSGRGDIDINDQGDPG